MYSDIHFSFVVYFSDAVFILFVTFLIVLFLYIQSVLKGNIISSSAK